MQPTGWLLEWRHAEERRPDQDADPGGRHRGVRRPRDRRGAGEPDRRGGRLQQGDAVRVLRQQGRTVDAVYTAAVDTYLAEVGFDTADLPGYAGRVFDYFEEHPEHQRLNIWYRLERPEGTALEAIVAVNKSRLGDLDQAQRSGVVPANFTPAELLALLQAIATSWSSMNPEYGASAPDRASRREAVVEAVRRLLTS